MNSLFSCSWVQNTALLRESSTDTYVLNENIAHIVRDVSNKIKKLKIGTPYRDVRLFFYQFLQDKYNDLIPDDYKKEISLTPEQALTQLRSFERPGKRLVRQVDENDDLEYAAQFGSNRYVLKLKGTDPKNVIIHDLTLEDIESAKRIITRKLHAKDVNALFDKMIVSQKDPTAFLHEVENEFPKYSEEKEEGVNDNKLVFFLNMLAGQREAGPGPDIDGEVEGELPPSDMPTREEIATVMAGEKAIKPFEPGADAYDTLKKNLQPDDEIQYLMRGMSGFNIFKAEVGNYEYRINLKGIPPVDTSIDKISPDNVGEIFVYDITKEPAKGERPPQVFSTEPEYSKIPEEPGDIEDTGPEVEDLGLEDDEYGDDKGHRISRPTSDWDAEDEETPCVHGCRCSKCMQKANSQPKKPEIVIKLSTEQVNKQMIEAYRRKQQNNHRIDRRYGLGY